MSNASNSDHLDPEGFAGDTRTEKYEIYEEGTWEVYDPWNARTIAVFNCREKAYEYLEWLNNNRA